MGYPMKPYQILQNHVRSWWDFSQGFEKELLEAGKEEKQIVIENGQFHHSIPAVTVVVDAGWSHKHTYNANSGVGVIFGNATKRLVCIGVRNKYCSICSIAEKKGNNIPDHQCFKYWSGSSTSMEPDIIVQGFNMSENMHGLRYITVYLSYHLHLFSYRSIWYVTNSGSNCP